MSVAGIDPYIGKTLAGKYEVIELLGRGGMSVVYKVRHLFMQRFEALKLMRTELGADNEALQRFQQESKAVAALRHVNIVTVLDFNVLDDGSPFLTMEFLEGKDLGHLIETEKFLTPERAIPLLSQVCAGLHHAHSRGVIHRDIKPSNILITTANGVDLPIIVDFGIAKILHADGSSVNKLTTTGQVFGSPLYMSPEQCNSQRIDERTDVYAVGCVFYHALTGVPPIMGNSPLETMMRQMNEKARPFSAVRPDHTVSPEVEKVILKALSKNPDDRYANMNELRQALLKAANMTITDLNSGSYIQSGGITPGIGTASGINNDILPAHPTSGSERSLPRSSVSNRSQTDMNDSQEISSSQTPRPRQQLFPTQESSGPNLVLEPAYQGLLRRPVVQISLSVLVILFIGLIGAMSIKPEHRDENNGDDSVEKTFEGEANGRKRNGGPRYADNDLAKASDPNLIASGSLPGSSLQTTDSLSSLAPGNSATMNSVGMASDYKAKPSRVAGRLNLHRIAELVFQKGQPPARWQYDESLVSELSPARPGMSDDGTVYIVCFPDKANTADFPGIARGVADQLKRNKIAVSATAATLRPDGLPIYMQEIKYASKDPKNPKEQRSSFVLYFNGSGQVEALQIVPGRGGNDATRQFIENEILPRFQVFKKS